MGKPPDNYSPPILGLRFEILGEDLGKKSQEQGKGRKTRRCGGGKYNAAFFISIFTIITFSR
jgi:hypothetical protein